MQRWALKQALHESAESTDSQSALHTVLMMLTNARVEWTMSSPFLAKQCSGRVSPRFTWSSARVEFLPVSPGAVLGLSDLVLPVSREHEDEQKQRHMGRVESNLLMVSKRSDEWTWVERTVTSP